MDSPVEQVWGAWRCCLTGVPRRRQHHHHRDCSTRAL